MRKNFATLAAALITGGLLGIAPLNSAAAATPTCDWVASYAGAWVPMYKAGNTVNCNMVRGTNSPAVQKLQHSMNLCYGENLVEDGDFGGKTRDALIRTQQKAGTAADGEYGPNTRKAMLHQAINGGCIRVP
ncbi:peptidoglycan-binding protein [Streptomyces sp. ISL-100]|uniref:peptidoglycan-binding domain-containing protein n=1 Tax=Streptomyces sp. ISL-100 TaxID=2819173 RepID=UPI001BEB71F3|nr:peptidoglycan-binding domain-containing protein [Streptomyces sp. ISL-100]MBT2400822.1 peptidoglycan-binding protein [Streptomyces sp. ISL-100]